MGPRASTPVPAGAQIVDGNGKFVVPGFTDTNVHLSLYGGMNDRYETLVRYHDRQPDIVLEAAQIQLRYGITTVRDSYGMLRPLTAVRDRIAAGGAIGPRILAAGNILGWSGPYSISFSLTRATGLTLFQEQMNDEIAQGGGEELMGMTPSELATSDRSVHRQGPGLSQVRRHESLRGADVHRILRRGAEAPSSSARTRARKMVETHATSPEGLRLAHRSRHRRHPAS